MNARLYIKLFAFCLRWATVSSCYLSKYMDFHGSADFGGSPCCVPLCLFQEHLVPNRGRIGVATVSSTEARPEPRRQRKQMATKIRARRRPACCVHITADVTWFRHGVALCCRSRAACSASQLELAGRTFADRSVSNHDGLWCEFISKGKIVCAYHTTPRFTD